MGDFLWAMLYSTECIWVLVQEETLKTLKKLIPHKFPKKQWGILSTKAGYRVRAWSFFNLMVFGLLQLI